MKRIGMPEGEFPVCSTEMADRKCCVKNCGSSSHDPLGRNRQNRPTFHSFPAWRTNEGSFASELTRRRRAAWVDAVGRSDITFDRIPSSTRVCSRHFHFGKPAFEMLDLDPDWVPSLHLGHENEGNRKKRRAADNCGLGLGRPTPPLQREVKSALHTLLQGKPNISQQNQAESTDRPAETSFRDFFRNALESSLEASIQSRARSKNRSSSTNYEVGLKFQLLPTWKESTSCENCPRLLRRIQDLEYRLFQVASKHHKEGLDEEKQKSRTGHLSPVEVRVDDSNVVLDSEMAPLSTDLSSQFSDLSDTESCPPEDVSTWT